MIARELPKIRRGAVVWFPLWGVHEWLRREAKVDDGSDAVAGVVRDVLDSLRQ